MSEEEKRMAMAPASSSSRSSSPEDRKDSLPLVPGLQFPHFALPLQLGAAIPALFSNFLSDLTRNSLSALSQLSSATHDRGERWRRFNSQNVVVTYRPSQNTSFTTSPLLPTTSVLASPSINTAPAPQNTESDESAQPQPQPQPAAEDGAAASAAAAAAAAAAGPAFIGQVFTMCDVARRGLIAVRQLDSPKAKKLPYLPSFITSKLPDWVDRDRGNKSKNDDEEVPVFRFYFDKNDAAAYVKNLGLNGSTVGSCPLDAAYKYYKGKPPMFRFIADGEQVRVAKQLLRKDQGRTVARRFRGVPVFTARNLTIAMSTPTGVRWFTPYFFDKRHLDKLIGHSVDHYYQTLIHARRAQRHSQVVDEFPGEPPEDDVDGLMDPPEVQEFMEEMGQGGNPFLESALLKTVEIQFKDMVDNVILGNKLSRRMAGLQPSFPVLVDSFEKRAAAAEGDLRDGPSRRMATSQFRSGPKDGSQPTTPGRSDESSSGSGSTSAKMVSQKNGREVRSPFQLFGRNWGFQFQGGRKGEGTGSSSSKELQNEGADNLGSTIPEAGRKESVQKEEPLERMQPKLTMMGIAMTEPETNTSDAVLQRAMAAAAKDIENRVRKGEGSGQEHGPLFIADLGGPPEIWGRENSSSFQGWESDDNE